MMLISASTTTLVFPWKKKLGHPAAEKWHLCLLQKGQNFLKAALRAGNGTCGAHRRRRSIAPPPAVSFASSFHCQNARSAPFRNFGLFFRRPKCPFSTVGRPDFFLYAKTKVVDLAEISIMAPSNSSLDDGIDA